MLRRYHNTYPTYNPRTDKVAITTLARRHVRKCRNLNDPCAAERAYWALARDYHKHQKILASTEDLQTFQRLYLAAFRSHILSEVHQRSMRHLCWTLGCSISCLFTILVILLLTLHHSPLH